MPRLMFGFNSWAYEVGLNGDNVAGVVAKGLSLGIPGSRRCMQYLVLDPKGQMRNAAAIRDVAGGGGYYVTTCGFNPDDGKDPKHERPRFSISDDPVERIAALDTGYALITNAKNVAPVGGEGHLGGPFYRMHGDLFPVDQVHYDRLVEFLAKLAQRAREEGVELDGEYLNKFELSGPNNARDLVRLSKDVKAAMHGTTPGLPLRTEFDTFHSFLEGEEVEKIPGYLASEGAIGSVHLGDTTRLALGTGRLKERLGHVLKNLYDAAGDGAEVPVVPEIFCKEFQGAVKIHGWPTHDAPIPSPHVQALESYKFIRDVVDFYRQTHGVNLLT